MVVNWEPGTPEASDHSSIVKFPPDEHELTSVATLYLILTSVRSTVEDPVVKLCAMPLMTRQAPSEVPPLELSKRTDV